MRKSRTSLEPFWDLKISILYVSILRATFSEKYCWLNFKHFLGLYNAVDK